MERHRCYAVAVGMAVVAVLGLMWQVELAAVLALYRFLQSDLVRGRCCTPDQGSYGMRTLSMHEDFMPDCAWAQRCNVLYVGGKSDHTQASLAHYDAVSS